MSKPATRSRRKQLKKRHKAKMRKLERSKQARLARKAAAQEPSPGATIMQDENQEMQPGAETQAAGEGINTTEVETEETLIEETEHVEAESTTENTAIVGEPGTEGAVQAAPGEAQLAINEPDDSE